MNSFLQRVSATTSNFNGRYGTGRQGAPIMFLSNLPFERFGHLLERPSAYDAVSTSRYILVAMALNIPRLHQNEADDDDVNNGNNENDDAGSGTELPLQKTVIYHQIRTSSK